MSGFTIDALLEETRPKLEDEHGFGECKSPPSLFSFSKCHRRRSTFSALQVHILEAEFYKNRYVSPDRRAFLANLLDLSQQQVKIWFQNRRYKTKTKPEASRRHNDQYLANLQAFWINQNR
ncbi:unnamed protein product [Bursaphelenchus okinawaensis]|uniref:Homeobox domain-containing protein n=1 Tax=Bursaphelenchus okinawaensis TaxID=465554 RepID=A0A811KPL3_9BILA|nr:unnamed protein product [Bursaphelenchus okinawaensis]CAG9106953.1 unnamed protein product [Bursaphelenchus okinawaensis]